MAEQTFNTSTVPAKDSVADDTLKPTAEMHILVGGPYTSDGEEHRYGHTAIRVKAAASDTTYDFGRYARVTGQFGAEGEGILRVWSSFATYIAGENSLKRVTTGFVFAIFEYQAKQINDYYKGLMGSGTPRTDLERGRASLKVYQLSTNYHALGLNCTTLSVDGAKVVFPNFEAGGSDYIKPEAVLSFAERMALKAMGTPGRLFLPANLQTFLSSKPAVAPIRTDKYGG